MAVTSELLGKFPILKNLSESELSHLAQHSAMRKFSRRGIVLNAGEKEEIVCFLFEGRLQGVDFTVDGREVGLYFVEPGDFCGELGLFDNGPQLEYVLALTPSVTVFVPMDALRDVMLKQPELVSNLSNKIASRVRQLTIQRSVLGLPNIAQRVCYQLWLLVPEAAKQQLTNTEIKSPPTHMEIAIMLNVSRETVTRVFQTLQNRQIVKRDGPGRLLINELNLLKALAEGTEEL